LKKAMWKARWAIPPHRRNLVSPPTRSAPVLFLNGTERFQSRICWKICDADAERDHYRKRIYHRRSFTLAYKDWPLLALPAVPLDVSKVHYGKNQRLPGGFIWVNGLHEYSVSPQYAK